MMPKVPDELLSAAAIWDQLHRWERRELGQALRRLGLTYQEIRDVVPVPRSTLSNWCRDVELSPVQVERIRLEGCPKPGIPRDTQRKRRQEIQEIREAARCRAGDLFREPLFAAGVALYWAEGAKTQSSLAMANTDPALLRLWMTWVRSYLDSDAQFSLRLHLHGMNNEPAAQSFWRRELELPSARFQKTYVKPKGTGHRKNRVPNGVCRVCVRRSSDFWHMTMAWIECAVDQDCWSLATLAPGR